MLKDGEGEHLIEGVVLQIQAVCEGLREMLGKESRERVIGDRIGGELKGLLVETQSSVLAEEGLFVPVHVNQALRSTGKGILAAHRMILSPNANPIIIISSALTTSFPQSNPKNVVESHLDKLGDHQSLASMMPPSEISKVA